MRTIWLALALVVLFGCLSQAQNVDQEWEEYKTKYGKVYETAEEEAKRKAIWLSNKFQINTKSQNSEEKTYKTGVNKFSDLTPEEFNSNKLGRKLKIFEVNTDSEDVKSKSFRSKPDFRQWRSIDWSGYLKQARDQGDCGSCWAFAATGAIEGALAIRDNRTSQNYLSPQDLVNCDQYDSGCNGGYSFQTLEWIKRNGVLNDNDQTYQARRTNCLSKTARNYQITKVSGYDYCSNYEGGRKSCGDYGEQCYQLLQRGPLLIGIDGSYESIGSYENGIFNGEQIDDNHAVVLVGFGQENGEYYWKVRNSWGTDWGENGYIRVSANKPGIVIRECVLPKL